MQTQNERVLESLKRAGGWVAMPDLSRDSGSLNVHSRVASLRLSGERIVNRIEHGNRGAKRSFYRLESMGDEPAVNKSARC